MRAPLRRILGEIFTSKLACSGGLRPTKPHRPSDFTLVYSLNVVPLFYFVNIYCSPKYDRFILEGAISTVENFPTPTRGRPYLALPKAGRLEALPSVLRAAALWSPRGREVFWDLKRTEDQRDQIEWMTSPESLELVAPQARKVASEASELILHCVLPYYEQDAGLRGHQTHIARDHACEMSEPPLIA